MFQVRLRLLCLSTQPIVVCTLIPFFFARIHRMVDDQIDWLTELLTVRGSLPPFVCFSTHVIVKNCKGKLSLTSHFMILNTILPYSSWNAYSAVAHCSRSILSFTGAPIDRILWSGLRRGLRTCQSVWHNAGCVDRESDTRHTAESHVRVIHIGRLTAGRKTESVDYCATRFREY